MPEYTFFNEKTEEYKDIFMSMDDKHEFIDENGYKWIRVFYSPHASFDTKWNEFDSRDFVSKTANKKGTLGDIMNKSKELSIKREEKSGKDSVKEKYYESYANARNGSPHIDKIREKAIKKLDSMDVIVGSK